MSRVIEERWKGIPNKRSNKEAYGLFFAHHFLPTQYQKHSWRIKVTKGRLIDLWKGWETVTICDLRDNSGIFELATGKQPHTRNTHTHHHHSHHRKAGHNYLFFPSHLSQSLLRTVNYGPLDLGFLGFFVFWVVGYLWQLWNRSHEWVDKAIEKRSKGINQLIRVVKQKAFCQLLTLLLLKGRYDSTGEKNWHKVFYKIIVCVISVLT